MKKKIRLPQGKIDAFVNSYRLHKRIYLAAKEAGISRITGKKLVDVLELDKETVDKKAIEEIAERISKLPDVKKDNFERLAQKLRGRDVLAILSSPSKFNHATKELASIGLLSILAELTDEEKIKNASLNALASAVPVLADVASGKYDVTAGLNNKVVDKNEIILKIQMAIKRIRQFNPSLSEEINKTIHDISDYKVEDADGKGEGGNSDTSEGDKQAGGEEKPADGGEQTAGDVDGGNSEKVGVSNTPDNG